MRKRASIWFAGAMIVSSSVFVLTIVYLVVGGFILRLNVSSFDEGGPHWPFAVVQLSLTVTFVLFVAWAIAFGLEIRYDKRRR